MSNVIDWIYKNLTDTEKEELIHKLKNRTDDIKLADIENGDIFKVGDYEFIKFSDDNGITTAVAKDIVFESDFGDNSNFAESEVLRRMKDKFLPKITAIVGAENLRSIVTDLTTFDGLKTYGETESYISIPTLDFYRTNIAIFDKYKLDGWWWTATAWSALPHYESASILCVSPSGGLNYYGYNNDYGVRPFLRFVSSIFVSRVS